MFYTEEDVAPVARIAVEMFGPNGNMLDGKTVVQNVIIGTKEFGKIWYGDVEGGSEFVSDMCTAMSARVGMTVTQVEESF
jgi:ABC-type lipopolysaccharide export system ATPase subunit